MDRRRRGARRARIAARMREHPHRGARRESSARSLALERPRRRRYDRLSGALLLGRVGSRRRGAGLRVRRGRGQSVRIQSGGYDRNRQVDADDVARQRLPRVGERYVPERHHRKHALYPLRQDAHLLPARRRHAGQALDSRLPLLHRVDARPVHHHRSSTGAGHHDHAESQPHHHVRMDGARSDRLPRQRPGPRFRAVALQSRPESPGRVRSHLRHRPAPQRPSGALREQMGAMGLVSGPGRLGAHHDPRRRRGARDEPLPHLRRAGEGRGGSRHGHIRPPIERPAVHRVAGGGTAAEHIRTLPRRLPVSRNQSARREARPAAGGHAQIPVGGGRVELRRPGGVLPVRVGRVGPEQPGRLGFGLLAVRPGLLGDVVLGRAHPLRAGGRQRGDRDARADRDQRRAVPHGPEPPLGGRLSVVQFHADRLRDSDRDRAR